MGCQSLHPGLAPPNHHSWAKRKADGETEAQNRHMPSARPNIQLPDMWVVCVWPGRRHECLAKDMSGTNRPSRSQGGPLKVKELEVGGEGAPPS